MLWGAVAVLAVVGGLAAYFVIKGGSDGIDGAAEVLPADAVQVRYVDRDAAADRLGVGDIDHGASSGDIDKYLKATQDAPWAVTPFGLSLAVMEDAPFNELDVDWSASVEISSGSETDQAPLNVYRMDDDLDLGDVADALADAGLKESEVDGHRRFQAGDASPDASGMIDGNLPAGDLFDVTVVEDEHLLVVGSEPERVLDVIDGDADSLADESDLAALGDRSESAEFAAGHARRRWAVRRHAARTVRGHAGAARGDQVRVRARRPRHPGRAWGVRGVGRRRRRGGRRAQVRVRGRGRG